MIYEKTQRVRLWQAAGYESVEVAKQNPEKNTTDLALRDSTVEYLNTMNICRKFIRRNIYLEINM